MCFPFFWVNTYEWNDQIITQMLFTFQETDNLFSKVVVQFYIPSKNKSLLFKFFKLLKFFIK